MSGPARPVAAGGRYALDLAWGARDAWALGGITAGALALRLVLFTGYFGSDDVNASLAAASVASGVWSTGSVYNASLRYGFILPMAASIRLFGFTEFTASVWALACSVTEVAVVYAVARAAWSRRAAVFAALAMAATPLHVLYGGMPTGDAPLALFITLSMALFLVAESRGGRGWYLAAGLSAGFTFWIKEYATVWVAVFGLYVLVRRTWNPSWGWTIAGALLMLAGNVLLFAGLTGDPLYYARAILAGRGVHERFIEAGRAQPLWFYARYLALDVRHTWILAHLAVAGGALLLARRLRGAGLPAATSYIVTWWVGLFLVLNLFVIKLRPLTFIFKQTNYMLLFWAPFALLAGHFLAGLPRRWAVPVTVTALGGGLVLSALEQQAVRAFTANSRAAWEFAKGQRGVPVYATEHALNMASVLARIDGDGGPAARIRPLSRLAPGAPAGNRGAGEGEEAAGGYVVLDLETIDWGDDPRIRPDGVPPCWELLGPLRPDGFGAGRYVARALRANVQWMPAPLARPLGRRLDVLVEPRPALVYRVPAGCGGARGERESAMSAPAGGRS